MRSRKSLTRVALLGVVALVAVMLMAVPGNATLAKKYDLSVTPPSIPAGGSLTFAAKYTNKSLYKIGSTALTVPTGFQIVVDPPTVTTTRGTIDSVTPTTVKVKNLNLSLGSSFTISVKATVPCGVGSGSWSASTQTGSTFTGGFFTYNNAASFRAATVDPCSLVFGSQPTNTGLNDPIEPSVTVQALNGAEEPVGGVSIDMVANGPGSFTNDSTTTAETSTEAPNEAPFTNLKLDAPGNYTLTASAVGFGSVDSTDFDVAGAVLDCNTEYPDGSIITEGDDPIASNIDLVRETGDPDVCDEEPGIAVTIVVRNNEVEITKPTVEGSAFTMTIDWTEEEFQYPLPPTLITYEDGLEHPMQKCLPDGNDDGYPDLPPRVDEGAEGNEFWCVTSLSVDELPLGLIEVSESYFGAGDPRVTRG